MWQDRGPLSIPSAKQGAPVKGKKKDFWTDQISTGGGIGGALGGAAAGAALGSVVPGIGTIIGGLAGGVLGGALGSGGGELAENFITGEEDKFRNVGQEALLGGIFSAPPIRAGKALIGAGKAVATGAGGAGARQAAETALTSRGILGGSTRPANLKTSALGRLEESGNQALASQYGTLSRAEIRSLSPAQTVKQLADVGITKPEDAERFASALTGSSGILTNAVNGAVAGANKKLNLATVRNVFNDALDNVGIVGNDRKSLETLINSQFGRLRGGANVSLNNVDPTDALSVMKSLEARIANLKGRGGNYRMTTPERSDQASVLQLVKDEIEDQLYNAGGANANIAKVLTPEVRSKLINLAPDNKRWTSYVDNNIMQATDVGKLRSAQAPFVRINQIISSGEDSGFSALDRIAQNSGGIRQSIANAAANTVRNPLARGYAAATRAVAGSGNGVMRQPSIISPVGVTARQTIGRGITGTNMGTQEQPLTLDDAILQQSEFVQPTAGSIFEQSAVETQQLEQPQSQNPYPQENLLFDIQRDPQNADKYIAYYQSLQEVLGQGAPEPLSQSNQSALASADNAENTINQLEGLFTQAGGGSGRIGGFVQNLAGQAGLDKNASVYNSLSQASVTQIAKALAGSGAGTVSDADARVIIQALPTLQDSPEEARAKFGALRQRLNAARENTMFYGQGGTSNTLEQALMQQGAF